MLNSLVQVAYSLSLNTLRSIHNKQSSLAGSDRTGYLIGKVNVSWGINQIQYILLTLVDILHLNSLAFDCNPTFPFQVHAIQGLFLEILFANGLGILQKTVGQCTLPMVDMGNNAKVADILHLVPVFQLHSSNSLRYYNI